MCTYTHMCVWGVVQEMFMYFPGWRYRVHNPRENPDLSTVWWPGITEDIKSNNLRHQYLIKTNLINKKPD